MPSGDTAAESIVRAVANAICEDSDGIAIKSTEDDQGTVVELFAAEQDMGRLIGKGGENAQAIRTLLRAYGAKSQQKFSFKVSTKA